MIDKKLSKLAEKLLRARLDAPAEKVDFTGLVEEVSVQAGVSTEDAEAAIAVEMERATGVYEICSALVDDALGPNKMTTENVMDILREKSNDLEKKAL